MTTATVDTVAAQVATAIENLETITLRSADDAADTTTVAPVVTPVAVAPTPVTLQTLKDVMPAEFLTDTYAKAPSRKYVNVGVVEVNQASDKPWPGSHKNIKMWVMLENKQAVGVNENPARGMGFPQMRIV